MKKKLFSLLYSLLLISVIKAQVPALQWVDAFHTRGTSQPWSSQNSICIDIYGNVYCGGIFQDTTDFDPGTSNYALTGNTFGSGSIVKMTPVGQFIWAKAITGNDEVQIRSIAVDADGAVYATGHFYGTADFDPGPATYTLTATSVSADFFVVKLDSSGNFCWAAGIGGMSYDDGLGIVTDNSGNVVLTGYFNLIVDFDPGVGVYNLTTSGYADAFILKLTSAGNFIWAKQISGVGSEVGTALDLDQADNIVISGHYDYGTVDFNPDTGTCTLNYAGSGTLDCFVVKLGSSGNFIWAKGINGSFNDIPYSLSMDAANSIYVCGKFEGVMDADPGATTHLLTSLGSWDGFITKLDSSGNFIWANQIGGLGDDVCYKVDVGTSVFMTGSYSNSVDFNPGLGTYNLTSTGTSTFVLKWDSAAGFQWAFSLGSAVAGDILSTGQNDFLLGGNYVGAQDFDPGSSNNILVSTCPGEGFLAYYSGSLISYETIKGSEKISSRIYPNPFITISTLDLDDVSENVELKIYNTLGNQVKRWKIISRTTTINRDGLESGIYFYQLTNDKKILNSGKLVVE